MRFIFFHLLIRLLELCMGLSLLILVFMYGSVHGLNILCPIFRMSHAVFVVASWISFPPPLVASLAEKILQVP